jgi:hypothetical protein
VPPLGMAEVLVYILLQEGAMATGLLLAPTPQVTAILRPAAGSRRGGHPTMPGVGSDAHAAPGSFLEDVVRTGEAALPRLTLAWSALELLCTHRVGAKPCGQKN